MSDNTSDPVDALLESAVARFLSGEAVDLDSIIAANPNHADAIRSRWAAIQRLRDPFGPMLQSVAAPASSIAVGAHIGEYEIVSEIGRGGMGIVFEAMQKHPRRPVALKVIRGSAYVDDHAVRMFQREIAALARLKHPGIAAIYGAGATEDGRHFFAMELVQGVPLLDYVRDNKLTRKQQLELFIRICEAVNYAHQRGVIHRDLKPGNILVETGGNPKVLDFGLARVTDADMNVTTAGIDAGRILGTLPYMSPEQVQGRTDEVDIRTDVYSLGIIVFEMLTGELPQRISALSIPQAVRTICDEAPKRPATIDRSLRGDVETIILKAMEKEPDRRYLSAAAIAEDLARHLSGLPIFSHPSSAVYEIRKLASRHKAASAMSLVLLLSLITFSIVVASMSNRLRHEKSLAEQARADAVAAELIAIRERDAAISAKAIERQERESAQRARVAAAEEAKTSEHVIRFIESSFMLSAPRFAKGKAILARDVLMAGAVVAEKELADRPLIQARVFQVLGNCSRDIGLLDQAEVLIGKSVSIRRELGGTADAGLSESIACLALVLQQKGEYRPALRYYKEALLIELRANPNGSRNQIIIRSSLGSLLTVENHLASATQELREALAMSIKLYGENDATTAEVQGNLGNLLRQQGNIADAEQNLRHCLQVFKTKLGLDHPNTLTCTQNLAVTTGLRGNFVEASQMLEDVLAIQLRVLGVDHPDTALTMHNKAAIFQQQGKLEESRQLNEKVLKIRREKLGNSHPDVATSLSQLASVLVAQNELVKAESCLLEALTIISKSFGDLHPGVLQMQNDLAIIYIRMENWQQAEFRCRAVLGLRQRVFGDSSSEVADSKSMLAGVLATLNKHLEAEALARDALRLFDQNETTDKGVVSNCLMSLAMALIGEGKPAEAETILRRALDLRKSVLNDKDWRIYNTMSVLGESILNQNRFVEAEPLLADGYYGMETNPGSLPFRKSEAASRLSRLYSALGNEQKASKFRQLSNGENLRSLVTTAPANP